VGSVFKWQLCDFEVLLGDT